MPRVEDRRLLRGEGRYTSDIPVPAALHGCFIRADRPHAAIKSIDATAALEQPGIAAVLTGADFEGLNSLPAVMPLRGRQGFQLFHPRRPALAHGCVRYVGEPVALVVAESYLQAQDAAELVQVEYEDLPFVVGTADAVREGAPALYPERKDNICFDWEVGDADAVRAAFESAAHVTSVELRNTRLAPSPMESIACVASVDAASGQITLMCGSQGATAIRDQLCTVLGLAADRLRVITGDVGGAFGAKAHAYPEYVAVIQAARKIGRPVRWASARGEAFLSEHHGRDSIVRAQLALNADANFLAMDFHFIANMGAYLTMNGALIMTKNTGQAMAGVYRTPAIHGRVVCVLSNTVPVGPYRGAGRPEMAYAIEQLIDAAAAEIGIDRIELRRRNLIRADDMPYRTPTGSVYDSGDFPAVLERALALSDWNGFAERRARSERNDKLRGIGIATFLEGTGAAPREKVKLTVAADGMVAAHCGTQSTGQGHETVFGALVARALGVEPASVRVCQGDSAAAGGGPSVASRSLHATGSALLAAADMLIACGRALAAHRFKLQEQEVGYSQGGFTAPGRRISMAELAGALPAAERETWSAIAEIEVQPTFPNGCHVAEVEIDPLTGETTICDYSCVDDFGIVADEAIVEGQLHGGIAQGAGEVLIEAVRYDAESGQLLSGSFVDYAMPVATLLPSVRSEFLPVRCRTNAVGSKGAGEAGTTGAVCALMSAIIDAVRPYGITQLDRPVTPFALWRALRAGRG